MMHMALIIATWSLGQPAQAISTVFNAAATGLYTSGGNWTSGPYTTGIQFAYGAETRGLVAFDVSNLPAGTIESATLRLQNPYTVNELGGPLELRLYGMPGLNAYNYHGDAYINGSVFASIGSNASPLWGTAWVAPVSWPGSTVEFGLPVAALDSLQAALTGGGLYDADFFAFGLKIVKADAEEPKPLQYVFGGTAAGSQVTLTVNVSPVPNPGSGWLLLSGLGVVGCRIRRFKRRSPCAVSMPRSGGRSRERMGNLRQR
jgi:hypothetical protein